MPDLTWEKEPRTNTYRAKTDIGDYTISFSGYDYILQFHPLRNGTPAVTGTALGRGYFHSVRDAAETHHRGQRVATETTRLREAPAGATESRRVITRDSVVDALRVAVRGMNPKYTDEEARLATAEIVAGRLDIDPTEYLTPEV